MLFTLIMAGGGGTRLWPRCRKWAPKQLWAVKGGQSLLQSTVNRINRLIPEAQTFIATSDEFAEVVREQLPFIPPQNFIFEPTPRDTGPAIGLAALFLKQYDADGTLVVLPADHIISDESSFLTHLKLAVEAAEQTGRITMLGVKPTRPETAYGYIKCADKLYTKNGISLYLVDKFKEKPDHKKAQSYMESGAYYWNTGIYIATLVALEGVFIKHQPGIYRTLQEMVSRRAGQSLKIEAEEYLKIPAISFDYSITEKEKGILMVPSTFSWDDVGSWSALDRALQKDEDRNVCLGMSVSYDTSNCLIDAGNKLVATLGLRNLIIVNTDDVILICDKNRDQEIKKLINKINKAGLQKYL
ncbi:MAG: mannose-1-phosphate guanylyltransferase [Bacillota bacterium]